MQIPRPVVWVVVGAVVWAIAGPHSLGGAIPRLGILRTPVPAGKVHLQLKPP